MASKKRSPVRKVSKKRASPVRKVSKKRASPVRKVSKKRASPVRKVSRRQSPMQTFTFLAYFGVPDSVRGEARWEWDPKLRSTKAVRIQREQHGTDDGGETYYVDAVVKAKDRDTVALWLNKHKNFSYIQDERISRV